MHTKASEDLACEIRQLTTKTLRISTRGDNQVSTFEITGCGGTNIFTVVNNTGYYWAVISDGDLRKKLAFNFRESCPTYSIEFVDESTRGVTACGQKLVYVFSQGAGWVANTVVDDAGNAK